MKKLALIGASGFVGKPLSMILADKYELVATYLNNPVPNAHKLDITQPGEYTSFLDKINPDIIVHSAALVDLEQCERNPAEAYKQNTEPVKTLNAWAKKHQKKIVLISTDGVFDGTKGNYSEKDKPNPINVYGQTKWEAEQILADNKTALILRIAVPYSAQIIGKKFLPSTIAKLKAGEIVTGATDLIRSPTLVEDVGEAILRLLKKDAAGTYHVTGTTGISLFDAAKTIARVFGYSEELVKPMLSTDIKINGVPSTVKRPADCSMNCAKALAEKIPLHSFEDGLKYVRSRVQNV